MISMAIALDKNVRKYAADILGKASFRIFMMNCIGNFL